MITNVAKVDLMSEINRKLLVGVLGTDGTKPTTADTELVEPVIDTIATLTTNQAGKQLISTYNLSAVQGNDNIFMEYGNYMQSIGTSEILLSRITFTGVPKNSSLEFMVKNVYNIL